MVTYGNVPQNTPSLEDVVLSIYMNEIDRLEAALNLARDLVLSKDPTTPRGLDSPPPPPKSLTLRDTIIDASANLSTIKSFLPLLCVRNNS